MTGLRVGFVLQYHVKARADEHRSNGNLIPSTLKLLRILQPVDQLLLKESVMLKSVEIVGQPEIGHDRTGGNRFRNTLSIGRVAGALKLAEMVIPLQNRMAFLERLLDLDVAPILAEDPGNVIHQEVWKRLPVLCPRQLVANSDELVAGEVSCDRRADVSVAADSFGVLRLQLMNGAEDVLRYLGIWAVRDHGISRISDSPDGNAARGADHAPGAAALDRDA
jgi:hypothetical protein